MTTSHFIETGQGVFHYLRTGAGGQPLFFCHGNSMSAGTYLPFLEKLSQNGFDITAPDIRGHGRSTKTGAKTAKSWDLFVEDLNQFVRQVNQPPLIGVGHSMGGFFVYAAAAMFPGLFSKIILLDPIILPFNILLGAALARKTGFADRHPLAKAALRKKSEFPSPEDALAHYSGKGMFKTWQPEFVKAFVDWSIEQDTTDTWTLCCDPAVEALMYVLVPLNTWRHAKKINIPVLVARGQHSEMFQDASGKKLERKIKNARFITIESQGHFFPMEDPDKTIAAIELFLKKSI